MGKKWMQKIDCYILTFFPYGCDVVFSIYSSCPAQLDPIKLQLGNFPVWIKSKLNILEHLNMEFQLNPFPHYLQLKLLSGKNVRTWDSMDFT